MKKVLALMLITFFFGLTNFVSAAETATGNVDDVTTTGTVDNDSMNEDNEDNEDSINEDNEDDKDNAIEKRRKELRSEAKEKRKELKGKAKEKREELKNRLKEKRDSITDNLKAKRKDFVITKVKTIKKYKNAFSKRLKNRLDKVPDNKLELVATRIDVAMTKVEDSTRLSDARKTRLLSQLIALKTIIDERLGIESEETDILNGLFDGIIN